MDAPKPELLGIPPEIRHMIWELFLSSTTFTFTLEPPETSTPTTTTALAPTNPRSRLANPLAVLLVNRQVYAETHHLAYSLITFAFPDLESLLEKLSGIPPAQLSQIKHVRTTTDRLVLEPYSRQFGSLDLIDSLMLLPGLQPSTIVLNCDGASGSEYKWCVLFAWKILCDIVFADRGVSTWTELRVLLPLSKSLCGFLVTEMGREELELLLKVLRAAQRGVVAFEEMEEMVVRALNATIYPEAVAWLLRHRWIPSHGFLEPEITVKLLYYIGEPAACTARLLVVVKRERCPSSTDSNADIDALAKTYTRNLISDAASTFPERYRGLTWPQIKDKVRSRRNNQHAENENRRRSNLALWNEDPYVNVLGL